MTGQNGGEDRFPGREPGQTPAIDLLRSTDELLDRLGRREVLQDDLDDPVIAALAMLAGDIDADLDAHPAEGMLAALYEGTAGAAGDAWVQDDSPWVDGRVRADDPLLAGGQPFASDSPFGDDRPFSDDPVPGRADRSQEPQWPQEEHPGRVLPAATEVTGLVTLPTVEQPAVPGQDAGSQAPPPMDLPPDLRSDLPAAGRGARRDRSAGSTGPGERSTPARPRRRQKAPAVVDLTAARESRQSRGGRSVRSSSMIGVAAAVAVVVVTGGVSAAVTGGQSLNPLDGIQKVVSDLSGQSPDVAQLERQLRQARAEAEGGDRRRARALLVQVEAKLDEVPEADAARLRREIEQIRQSMARAEGPRPSVQAQPERTAAPADAGRRRPAPSPAPTTEPAALTKAGAAARSVPDEPVLLRRWDGKMLFVVHDVRCGVRSIGEGALKYKAKKKDQLCLVDLTVENRGTTSHLLPEQKLFADGAEYTSNAWLNLSLGKGGTQYTTANPGARLPGTLVFELPVDAEPDEIRLQADLLSPGVRAPLPPTDR